MSTIPKAKRCHIADLTVTPNDWDHHPAMEYSHVNHCKFSGLTGSTHIERCELVNTNLHSDGTAKSRIERSVLKDCDVQHAEIERSDIHKSLLDGVRIERSKLVVATLSGPKLKVERSVLESCDIKGKGKIERSNVKESLLEDVRVEWSNVKSSYVTKSSLERANVEDCDVGDCKIQRTNFRGMYLRNGIWERNDLVGRVDKTKEVIIKHKDEMMIGESDREKVRSFEIANGMAVWTYEHHQPTTTSSPEEPTWNPDVKVMPPPTLPEDTTEQQSSTGILTPPSPTQSTATGILDDEIARAYIRDDYDGPEIESLPPYDEIIPRTIES
jgi:uncharacterized protein YjbI with pentapeptide repeats